MLTKENSKISHKSTSMKPIEQGIFVQVNHEGRLKNVAIVGRLFGVRELFVCYNPDIPQNCVEIAFRIALSSIG